MVLGIIIFSMKHVNRIFAISKRYTPVCDVILTSETRFLVIKGIASRRLSLSASPALTTRNFPLIQALNIPSLLLRSCCDDAFIKVDKQLSKLMRAWRIDEAVEVLSQSLERNSPPSGSTVVNLLQQLGNLGEVDALLNIKDSLFDNKLCSANTYYQSLLDGYYNSGRLSEGVDVMKLMYYSTRDFGTIDILFMHLTIMILQDFPGHLYKLEEFVQDCQKVGDFDPLVGLWKCCVLCEQFEKADKLVFGILDTSKDESALSPEMLDIINHMGDNSKSNISDYSYFNTEMMGESIAAEEESALTPGLSDASNNMHKKSKSVATVVNGKINSDSETHMEQNCTEIYSRLRVAVNEIETHKYKVCNNRISVLKYLCELPFIKRKQKALLMSVLLELLSEEGDKRGMEQVIDKAIALGLEDKIMEYTDDT